MRYFLQDLRSILLACLHMLSISSKHDPPLAAEWAACCAFRLVPNLLEHNWTA
jgi:hypothetical protein